MPITAECPDCAATVTLAEDVMAGEIVPCPECGRELETVSGEPWTLVPSP
jgi:alpha-aminoadipate carrier protein LysW